MRRELRSQVIGLSPKSTVPLPSPPSRESSQSSSAYARGYALTSSGRVPPRLLSGSAATAPKLIAIYSTAMVTVPEGGFPEKDPKTRAGLLPKLGNFSDISSELVGTV
ncbi:hypothetical protein MRX96_031387 [Rhipicephalus microplus]